MPKKKKEDEEIQDNVEATDEAEGLTTEEQSEDRIESSDPYPNKAKYSDGYVFNLPLSYFEQRTLTEIREELKAAGTEPEFIQPHIDLIKEAADFHGVKIGEPSLVEARKQYEENEAIANSRARQ